MALRHTALLLAAGTLVLGGATRGLSEAPTFATLKPSPLRLISQSWNELQFIQADQQGRVFVLRGSPVLEVFALEGGKLKAKGRLEGSTIGPETETSAEIARLSLGGDLWFLFKSPTTVEVFEGGKRTKTLESTWQISDVAAGSRDLTVSVIPVEINTPSPESPTLRRPPEIRRWDGKRWETSIEGDYTDEEPPGAVSWNLKFKAVYSSLIAFTPEGDLWLAHQYSPRVRHYSPSGLLKDELVLGAGKIDWFQQKPADREAQERSIDDALRRSGFSGTMSAPGTVPRATYRAIAIGRDGFIYLLAETAGGVALDRLQPNNPRYERLLLNGCQLGAGALNFVAGRHELILGARQGKGGTWEIPYQALDEAKWKQVPNAFLDGIEIGLDEDPGPPNRM